MHRTLFSSFALAIPAMPTLAAAFPPVHQPPHRPQSADPLVTLDGTKVATREQWTEKRRPELKALIQHYMYGYLPKPLPVTAKVERTDPKALEGKATLKEVTVSFGLPDTPKIHLLLVVPN